MHAGDSTNRKGWLGLGLVAALALAVPLLPWPQVFTPEGVVLMADGDTYYHALQAERIARGWPHVPWFDRGMNHPAGAAIPWPPLLDQVIATTAPAKPEMAVEERRPDGGTGYAFHPAFLDLVGSRPWFFDGNASDPALPVFGAYRLLAGLEPGTPVVAAIPVRTNVGRDFECRTRSAADGTGFATLRVPYATGLNGRTLAGLASVEAPGRWRAEVRVDERAFVTGGVVNVRRPGGDQGR